MKDCYALEVVNNYGFGRKWLVVPLVAHQPEWKGNLASK